MNFRLNIALLLALFVAALLAPSARAQRRGMHASAGTPRSRSSFRPNGRGAFAGPARRRFSNGSAWLYPPYFYSGDEFDYQPEAPPARMMVAQPAEPPAPPARLIGPLLLENRNGVWVRVPTGSQIAASQIKNPDSALSSSSRSGINVPAEAPPPPADLPPAVIVFRDGRREEIGKYVIQGDSLFTSADYWNTGSWTRNIPLAELDIPAILKLNQERGSKFTLPSRSNEVVVRF